MKKRILLSLCLLLSAPLLADPLRNPVLGPGLKSEIADPFVLKFNGEYYLYSSDNPVKAWHSTDLVHWDSIGPVLHSSDRKGAWNGMDVWAPEVDYRNGKFYMYYTATVKDPDWRVQEAQRRIGVAVSKSPRGPFVDTGRPLSAGWGIDGDVLHDPDTGKDWLYYSYLDEKHLHGAGLAVDQLLSPVQAAGHPTVVLHGTMAWEDKDGNPHNGTLRYTNEGPTALKRDGLYYVMYSGGSWDLPTYALSYAWSHSIQHPCTKADPPLLHSTRFVEGPGHNCVVKAPDNVDDVCLYHARVYPFLDPWNRMLFVDRLYWNHGQMAMDQPSIGWHAAPDRPVFEDRFDTDGAPGADWTVQKGHFAAEHGVLNGQGLCVGGPSLVGMVAEVNVQGGARAGASLVSKGGAVDVLLDRSHGTLDVGTRQVPLPVGFPFDVWHQLLLTRNGPSLQVDLDGTHVLKTRIDIGPARLGLKADGKAAAFDGVAVTDAWRDATPAGWTAWAGTGIHTKGDPAVSLEFATTFRWLSGQGKASRVGVALRTPEGHRLIGALERTIWPFARFYVTDGAGKVLAQAPLPRGFLYDAPHTLRMVKTPAGVTFHVDQQELCSVTGFIGPASPGVYTRNAQAHFADCTYRQIVSNANLLENPGFETEQWGDGGQAVPGNPWTTEGGAREAFSGLSGVRRMVIVGKPGRAVQQVQGLMAGHYVLRGMVNVHGDAHPAVSIDGQVTPLTVRTTDWEPFEVPFDVTPTKLTPEAHRTAVGLSADPQGDGQASFDDLYLSQR